jgi:glutamyl-tRNA reductase
MTLIAFGINHKTAPVELREKVAFSDDTLVDALASLRRSTGAEESVIISTCNRTEIYAQAEDLQLHQIEAWLADFHGLEKNALSQNSYSHSQQDAVQHIMRVASGLDSLILGEPQILGQVKQAYTSAKDSGSVNGSFERLFQQTFSVAKKVRSETEIGANAVSVAYAAVQLAKHIFSSLQNTTVLLIGAGETIELVARHLKDLDVKAIIVANRTLERARLIAQPLGAKVLTLAQIPHNLQQADIVISSTASQLPILGKGMVESALKQRRYKPMFLVDLAVPRDIEGEVSELDDAYLYTVDDLQHIVEQNLASRQNAALEAEKLIAVQVQTYLNWTQSQESIDLLRDFRQQSELQRDKLQARALNQLAEGKDAEQVIIELANKLTNSLIHSPTKALKQAAETQDKSTLELLRQTLGIESGN